MVDRFIQFINWIFDSIFLVYSKIVSGIKKLLGKIQSLVFKIASGCKKILDKVIKEDQREKLRIIIDESDTTIGRRFDTIMIIIISLSVLVVIFETVAEVKSAYWWIFFVLEWIFTIIFTLEYIFRLYSSRNPLKYATSFFGIIDLLSIIPTYLGLFLINAQNLMIVRALRLLRVFRIFKMGHFVKEGSIIVDALKASKIKIYVFISFTLLISILIGSLLYLVEGRVNPGFDNIPKGIYWAIVTLTTVGYGDIAPITPLGRFCALAIMIMGYGIIAVPTGIVTAEISNKVFQRSITPVEKDCKRCAEKKHLEQSNFCHRCGEPLENEG